MKKANRHVLHIQGMWTRIPHYTHRPPVVYNVLTRPVALGAPQNLHWISIVKKIIILLLIFIIQ